MITIHIFFIAIIQGITEFLPVSSSAHLIILPYFMKVVDQGVVIDISVHLGSLFALLIYFKQDTSILFRGMIQFFLIQFQKKELLFFLKIVTATIPIIFIGLIFKIYRFDIVLRSVEVIGWTMIIFGILLYLTDKFGGEKKTIDNWGFKSAFIVGIFQAISLIPGTSRSGITITGLRVFGYDRYNSIKISLLMSIPTIILSVFFITPSILKENNVNLIEFFIPFALSFIASLIALKILINYIYIFKFTPYIIYRITLGLILLYTVYC